MASREIGLNSGSIGARAEASAFAPLSARRLLVIGGIALILLGMIFGDVFAVFVLHPNADRIGQSLLAASEAVSLANVPTVEQNFAAIGQALENRGTKVDAHLHMVDFGYLALLLALVLPYVALDERVKKRLALLLITGAFVLPIGVFAIHYVGLAYSPVSSIGWASIIADAGGLAVILASAGFVVGLCRYRRSSSAAAVSDPLPRDRSWSCRVLLAGGTLLILAGFLHGAWYAARDLYHQEELDVNLLSKMTTTASQPNAYPPSAFPVLQSEVAEYGALQADHAVKIAAHAHIIEFGFVAMLAAFFQPYVFLRERWKRRWAMLLLLGGVMLPVFVLLELRLGLLAGGLADVGGFLVIVALAAMLTGVLRYTGRLDAVSETASSTGGAS